MDNHPPTLHVSSSHSASVTRLGENSWRLEIPAHGRRVYTLAQLDDHRSGRRSSFPWKPDLSFSLQARVSAENLPGTWGFGLWNDPFSFLLGYGGVVLRLPALPEAAWFFYASDQNYLSFRNDLPAKGFLAATFRSAKVPAALLMLTSPVMALSVIPWAAQWVRSILRRLVKQDAVQVQAQLTEWHAYRLDWQADLVSFYLDEVELLRTSIAPHPPLTLVVWIDNQYAAMPPTGGLKYGYLPNLQPAWLDVREVRLGERR